MTSDMYQSSFSSRPQPPISTLFPYTTLFRSLQLAARVEQWRRRGAAVELLSRQQVLRLTGSGQPQHLLARQQRSEEHTSELQSQSNIVCRLLLEKKNYTEGGQFNEAIKWNAI